MKNKPEVIAEIIGCKSTDVMVIETVDGTSYHTAEVVTDEQHEEVMRFLETGIHMLLWAYETKIRIIAPVELADENPQMLLFLYKLEKVRNLPIVNDGKNMIIYCNEIMDGEQSIIDGDSRIIVENNPNYGNHDK